ncbi:MAG: TonB-dependent receptor plug domain-containing protein, partial [Rhodospirillaceae bacterium]|nr:TonB-dependent receptor plug domain-containing protein [Rhodospirillaceae bacterium]
MNTNSKHGRSLVAVGAALTAFGAAGIDGALAQAGTQSTAQAGAIEEIIVTTRKREEALQDIPISIVAISARQLEQLGLNDLQDIARITPGLTFDRSISQNDFRPAIRGLQAERGRNSVGVLIDDIDITSEGLAAPGGGGLARQRLMDVERVEVVKGPQAALYGRAAFGGAVNYITKRPSLTEGDLKAMVEVNSEAGYQVRASGGAPVVQDKFGLRMNAYFWDERGSYRNTKSGAYVGGGDGAGIAAGFLAQATDNLSFYGRVEYSKEQLEPQAAFVLTGNTVVAFDADSNAAVPGTATSTIIFTGPITNGTINFDINPRTGRDYPGMDQETFRTTLITDWAFEGIDFKALTSWVDNDIDIFQDNDFVSGSINGVVARGGFQETERIFGTRQFSQELRLSSNNESPLQWFFGG